LQKLRIMGCAELRSKYLSKSFMEKPARYRAGLIVAVLYYPWPGLHPAIHE
jgi:hypothetical protein